MCPLLTETGLYAFIAPSPKEKDLRRDGRHANVLELYRKETR